MHIHVKYIYLHLAPIILETGWSELSSIMVHKIKYMGRMGSSAQVPTITHTYVTVLTCIFRSELVTNLWFNRTKIQD